MKRPKLEVPSASSEDDTDRQIQEAVTKAITESNDKIVEIRPAKKSKRGTKLPLMLFFGGAFAAGYLLRKSGKSTRKLKNAMSKTSDKTKDVSEQAVEAIEKNGETMAEDIEEGSQKASEQLQQMSESVAEKTEQAGETMAEEIEEGSKKASEQVEQKGENAAEKTEKAGKKAATKADESGSNSSSSSSGGSYGS